MKLKFCLQFKLFVVFVLLGIGSLGVSGCRSNNLLLMSITITPNDENIILSETQQFTAIGTYSDDSTADITSSVTWNSSDSSITTLDTSGLATSLTVGIATITASLDSITSNSASLEIRQAYAYISNFNNNTVSICPIESDGSFGTCNVSDGEETFAGPSGLSVSADGFAYVANFSDPDDGSVSICAVNPEDGSLGDCNLSIGGTDPTLSFLIPTGVALGQAETFLYASNFGDDTIAVCPVNDDGSLGPCTASDGNETLSLPQALVVNGDFLYVANIPHTDGFPSGISICPLESDGSLGTCTTTNSDGNGTISNPVGVAFNADGTILYVSNYADGVSFSISICLVGSDGGLETCTATEASDTLDFSAFTLDGLVVGSNQYIYIPNSGNNTVSLCPLNEDGTFGSCSALTDATFDQPSSMTIGSF